MNHGSWECGERVFSRTLGSGIKLLVTQARLHSTIRVERDGVLLAVATIYTSSPIIAKQAATGLGEGVNERPATRGGP